MRIDLTWSAFAKRKPILTLPKPTLKFKMHLFKAACTSILLYRCEAWVLMQALTAKLDKFARKCYQCMVSVKLRHMTNMVLYLVADEHLILEIIHERHLQFTAHCFCMPKNEPANIYVIYQGKIRQSNRRGNSGLT